MRCKMGLSEAKEYSKNVSENDIFYSTVENPAQQAKLQTDHIFKQDGLVDNVQYNYPKFYR